MQFVAVFTAPKLVFWDHLLTAIWATQVQNFVIVENDFDVATDLKEFGLRRQITCR
jgi:hypothetical protein